jgi:hypothetical protein
MVFDHIDGAKHREIGAARNRAAFDDLNCDRVFCAT